MTYIETKPFIKTKRDSKQKSIKQKILNFLPKYNSSKRFSDLQSGVKNIPKAISLGVLDDFSNYFVIVTPTTFLGSISSLPPLFPIPESIPFIPRFYPFEVDLVFTLHIISPLYLTLMVITILMNILP